MLIGHTQLPVLTRMLYSCEPRGFSTRLLFGLHIHGHPYIFPEHLIQKPLIFILHFSNRKLSSYGEEVPMVLEVPVLFCRAWLYSPPGTPTLCLCNRVAPTSHTCLRRSGGGGCRCACGNCRRGFAWPSEELPSTPDAPLWTRTVRHWENKGRWCIKIQLWKTSKSKRIGKGRKSSNRSQRVKVFVLYC